MVNMRNPVHQWLWKGTYLHVLAGARGGASQVKTQSWKLSDGLQSSRVGCSPLALRHCFHPWFHSSLFFLISHFCSGPVKVLSPLYWHSSSFTAPSAACRHSSFWMLCRTSWRVEYSKYWFPPSPWQGYRISGLAPPLFSPASKHWFLPMFFTEPERTGLRSGMKTSGYTVFRYQEKLLHWRRSRSSTRLEMLPKDLSLAICAAR